MPVDRYHHGNLRPEILDTSMRMVRDGGMTALVAREVARDVGVTPAAVYRHFADVEHLRAEVGRLAREELARALLGAQTATHHTGPDQSGPDQSGADQSGTDQSGAGPSDPGSAAVARFNATGTAYVRFAQKEPGLFDAAFAQCSAMPGVPDDPSAWAVLNDMLDELVTVGLLDPALRPDASLVVWTAVHGLASIITRGGLPPEVSTDQAISSVLAGLRRSLGLM